MECRTFSFFNFVFVFFYVSLVSYRSHSENFHVTGQNYCQKYAKGKFQPWKHCTAAIDEVQVGKYWWHSKLLICNNCVKILRDTLCVQEINLTENLYHSKQKFHHPYTALLRQKDVAIFFKNEITDSNDCLVSPTSLYQVKLTQVKKPCYNSR